MSTLVVQKLNTELSQDFRLSLDTRYNIGAVIPYLYMHNAPTGSFTVSVKSGATTLASNSFTCSDIKTSLGTAFNYAHVFYPVNFETTQLGKGTYTLELSASGYSPSESSYVGWVQQHEDLNNLLDYEPLSDAQNPLAFRLKIWGTA